MGEEGCKAFDNGILRTRADALESMGSFFEQADAEALVDTSIEVLCPQHRDKLPRSPQRLK
jgi:hypothetical protein